MDGPVQATGANGSLKPPSTASTSTLDPMTIVDHLRNVLIVNLGATERDLEAPKSLLSEANLPDTIQRCTRFASESQVALYISQNYVESKPLDGQNGNGMFGSPGCVGKFSDELE